MNEELKTMLVEGLKIQMEPMVTELWKLMASVLQQLEETGMEFDEALDAAFNIMLQGVIELAQETDFETLLEEV